MYKIFKKICVSVLIGILSFSLFSCSNNNQNSNNYIPESTDGAIVKPTENYNVTFVTNGGTSVSPKKATILTEAPTTIRTDYLFDGWYLDRELNNIAKFPLTVEYDINLYAKWLLLKTTNSSFSSCSIKCWEGNNANAVYYITPTDLDLVRLAELGYSVKIKVTYQAYYKKDYDVPFDIGYAGAPKFNVSIENSDGLTSGGEDIVATKSTQTYSLTYLKSAIDLIGQRLMLKFSTANIQNIVNFKNIVVTYDCYK